METTVKKNQNIKFALHDIILDVTWSKISKRYFGKSSSWIYNKLNGIDGNGGDGGFTDEERELLRGALVDFADRLRVAADKI
ncbi:MAG: DUF5053 domain-containing protein [Bacteroidales bacterium 45-6]|nr:MAG: DUF5053 domain-containing protein [Bacteroidales bacterium 45-6]